MTNRKVAPLAVGLSLIASGAAAHEWYSGLKNPTGGSCCNGKDCFPVESCSLPDRKEGLQIEGACRPIPRDRIIDLPSPDGQLHACWGHLEGQPNILCVIMPGEV
ncbi:MAG: hypothetical protein K0S42_122 [Microvirga sp.]|jgi:hypothetical protein|nr:hypothetical protein [Microvirga sp.]